MNTPTKAILGIFLLVLLAACTATGTRPESTQPVEHILAEKNLKVVEEVDRLVNFNIHSWEYVNFRNVILRDGASTRYLVELMLDCRDLQFAQAIAFTSFGRIVNTNDQILVTNAGGHVMRCNISAFYKLEQVPDLL